MAWGSVSIALYRRPFPGPLPYTLWAKVWIYTLPGVSVHRLLLEVPMAMRLAAASPPPTASLYTNQEAICVRRPPAKCVFTLCPKLCTGGVLKVPFYRSLQQLPPGRSQLTLTIRLQFKGMFFYSTP